MPGGFDGGGGAGDGQMRLGGMGGARGSGGGAGGEGDPIVTTTLIFCPCWQCPGWLHTK